MVWWPDLVDTFIRRDSILGLLYELEKARRASDGQQQNQAQLRAVKTLAMLLSTFLLISSLSAFFPNYITYNALFALVVFLFSFIITLPQRSRE